ncbi:MAG: hypothetical protein HGB35_00020 [Geobacteraceae bacterium]|nr:hypothetical protein [Geobacteraceae bacterium]
MAITPITNIPPQNPDRTDRATFSSLMAAMWAWCTTFFGTSGTLNTFITQLNNLIASGFPLVGNLNITGNLGVGLEPSNWGGAGHVDVGQGLSLLSGSYQNAEIMMNGYIPLSPPALTYKSAGVAMLYRQNNSGHSWHIAPTGSAGGPITFSQVMSIDTYGNFQVNAPGTTSYHKIIKNATQGGQILSVDIGGTATFNIYAANNANYSATAAVAKIGVNSSTGRSVCAGGTVNTNGSDYAEYECNNGLSILKGAIVGFRADGTLTLTYAEAARFGIKSTNPSFVGGDTWGAEDRVGVQPEDPQRRPDITEQRELTPATEGTPATFETVVVERGDTDDEWAAKLDAYKSEIAEFEGRLESARQLVDRIAYSGKVPVNIIGADPGDYIYAAADESGAITGLRTADPDFVQYKRSVGRVNRILEDGRAEVAVIIH